MLFLLICTGMLGAYSLTLFKFLGELLRDGAYKDSLGLFFFLLILGLLANLFNMIFLNISMKYYDQLDVIPIFMTAYLVFGICSGMIFFDEASSYTAGNLVGIVAGILVCMLGIVLLVMKNAKVKTVALTDEA